MAAVTATRITEDEINQLSVEYAAPTAARFIASWLEHGNIAAVASDLNVHHNVVYAYLKDKNIKKDIIKYLNRRYEAATYKYNNLIALVADRLEKPRLGHDKFVELTNLMMELLDRSSAYSIITKTADKEGSQLVFNLIEAK